MARILPIATHGSEDTYARWTRVSVCQTALDQGHQPEVILAGDAAVFARQTVAENVIPVGLPPLKDLTAFTQEHKVPVYT